MMKTKDVDKYLYVNFLRRAAECGNGAVKSLEAGEYTSAAISAVHSCIAAVDALCVFYLSKRHAGYNHDDSVKLMESIRNIERQQLTDTAARVRRVMRAKNMAEYEERLMKKQETERLVADAGSVLAFAVEKLPRG